MKILKSAAIAAGLMAVVIAIGMGVTAYPVPTTLFMGFCGLFAMIHWGWGND
jgi:hypothetical protein